MRGQLQDVLSLGKYFSRFESGQFQAIVLDAFYRFMPRDSDENDNGTMAQLYNEIDAYADHLIDDGSGRAQAVAGAGSTSTRQVL